MTNPDRAINNESDRARIAEAIERAEQQLITARQTAPIVTDSPVETNGWISNGTATAPRQYPLDAAEDRAGYHQWLRRRGEPIIVVAPRRNSRTRRPRFRAPLISLVLYAPDGTDELLGRSAGSVFAQTFASWELLICDDGSEVVRGAVVAALAGTDRRVRVISAVTDSKEHALNTAVESARGAFVAVVGARDELAPDALKNLAGALASAPDADVAYTDEDRLDADGERFAPNLKPSWSPDLLLGLDYIGRLAVVRRTLVSEVGGFRDGFAAAAEYDFILRATERARSVLHVTGIEYHRRVEPIDTTRAAAAPSTARATADALRRRGERSAIIEEGPIPSSRNVRYQVTTSPLVSIIVPFRDEPALLAMCSSSTRANPGYGRFEFILVDNDSELPETFALVDRLLEEPNVKLVKAPGPFNWSAINNAAVRVCNGELLLFMNNDIEARKPRWLDALVGHAMRPEVGAVGARLLYPDGALQHGGVVFGLGGLAAHVLRGLPGERPGYGAMAVQTRDCTAVTGACMMTRRALFESMGGFDETLPASFNDVDYCLKLRDAGLLVVYAPLCELVHHESRSRGHTEEKGASKIMFERWGHVIAAGDAYHNALLSKWKDWCAISTAQEDARWKTYLTTTVLTPQPSSNK